MNPRAERTRGDGNRGGRRRKVGNADDTDPNQTSESLTQPTLNVADDFGRSIVALCYSAEKRRLGFACFEELENTLYADAITAAIDEVETILESLKEILKPTLFLIHPNIISNAPFMETILCSTDGTPNFYRYKALKSSHWNYESATRSICTELEVKDPSGERSVGGGPFSAQLSFQRLSALMNLDDSHLCQSLGALLFYLQDSVFQLDSGKVVVSSVKSLPMESYMKIDRVSFEALQIFDEEIHPNIIKGVGRNKEGFSIFGLFDRTRSLPGRHKLKDWMSKPFYDRSLILHRQKGVELFARRNNEDFVIELCKNMRHISDLRKLLLRFNKAEASHSEWCKLHTTLCAASKILYSIILFIRSLIDTLRQELANAIDFELSAATQKVELQSNFDEELDHLKEVFAGLETELVVAAHLVLEVAPKIQNVSVEYVPQIGFLVAVHKDQVPFIPARDPSLYAEEDDTSPESKFVFLFHQNDVHYFKHAIVCAMDDRIGDIQCAIADRQKALVRELEDTILTAEPQLQHLCTVLSSLDALISLGTIAVEQNMVLPQLVDEPVILVKQGRHLLQELTVDNFIPNDVFINREKNIALISGPNASGKSVYLKQVGLIVYLAHLGSFVPSQKAVIGLTDRILTRISNIETVSTPHSSFCLDLIQISRILSTATPNSLCLVDEFGKGTSPIDGIALLAATVKHFVSHKSKLLFVLHFTELMTVGGILTSTDLAAINTFFMDTLRPPRKDARQIDHDSVGVSTPDRAKNLTTTLTTAFEEDDETADYDATPLYKLKIGVADSSDGIACAFRAGLGADILKRMEVVKSNILAKKPIPGTAANANKEIRRALNATSNSQLLRLLLSSTTAEWAGDLSERGEGALAASAGPAAGSSSSEARGKKLARLRSLLALA